MKICQVSLTVSDVGASAAFYRNVLEMPVDEGPDRATVIIGFSRLVLVQGGHYDGVHHLAFGISPHDFEMTRQWLKQRVELITAGDSSIIEGPEGWNSKSVYFRGPEEILLEFIAREADSNAPSSIGPTPRALSISEVGIGVADVGTMVDELVDTLSLPKFPPQETSFAPVGDHDGLFILVEEDRVWFPSGNYHAARGPLTVEIEGPAPSREVQLTASATVVTNCGC